MSLTELRAVSVHFARVVLLAGPSGSGKSYVARRTGLPVLCLDDFYKDGDDPTLPRAEDNVDWESPASWDAVGAVDVINALAAQGHSKVPVYDISQSLRVAERSFAINDQPLFIAEGIFAAEIVEECARRGILADAIALKRPRTVTFARRLVRDLAEKRKPPKVLIRRGYLLWRIDSTILRRQCDLGCRPLSATAFWRRIAILLRSASRKPA